MLLSTALSIGFLVLGVGGQLPPQAVFNSSNLGDEGHVITPEFSRYVERIINATNVPGLSLAIVRKDGIPEFAAWGRRTEDGAATTSNTLFYLASCSKAFLASAFGILMDDFASGKNTTALPPGLTTFDWNTKVKDIMPDDSDWSLMDQWAYEKANIHDILSHVSGLPRHDFSVGLDDRLGDVVGRMKFLRPAFELRQQWSYNNLMFMLSSYIISHYTGSYTSFVKDRIFTPLNMTSTTFSLSEAVRSGEMTDAWTSSGRRIPQWLTDEQIELTAGPGGIISSSEDMAKWMKTLLNFGIDTSTNTTIIPRSVFDEITTAHAIIEGIPGVPEQSISGYGMGWIRLSLEGHDAIFHNGGLPGSSTLVLFLPGDGIGVVVLVNADGKDAVNVAVMKQAIDDMLGIKADSPPQQPRQPQQPKPPLQHTQNCSDGKPETSIRLDKYAGTYSNPGYGSITLCDPSNSRNSSYCAQVLSDFATVDALQPSQAVHTQPQLFAKWSRLWSSHVRLVHVANSESGHQFNVQPTALFTEGFGADKTPFEIYESGLGGALAEFVVEGDYVLGLGVFGDLTKTTENTVQGIAEVWFDKSG